VGHTSSRSHARRHRSLKAATAATVIALAVASTAAAITPTLDSVGADWSNPAGPGIATVQEATVGSEVQIRWGAPSQSGLGFTPTTTTGQTLADGAQFELGTLRHFNTPVNQGTGITTVDLTVSLGLSDPTFSPDYTFGLEILETTNAEPCPYPSTTPCSDKIIFPVNFPNQAFTVDGTTAEVRIAGFRTTAGGPLLDGFVSDEGLTNSAILYGTFNVVNNPPVADANGPYLTAVNVPVMLDGALSSDPDGDVLTYAWDLDNDGLFDNATGVTPSASFSSAGVYTVGLKVCDDYTTPACDTTVATVVVYDPSAGFVTGGGWIDSPEGAYVPDASLSGKATFGFVSKYKVGATVPTGNTEFQFQAGDLNFHSTSYQWLVVTGGNSANFKGVGTVNGEGEYLFKVWASDGSPDTFRIKIWTEAGGVETVLYDNGSLQPIGAGSIVIHTKK
jgi:hypothetical protein